MIYSYKGIDAKGAKKSGQIEADSLEQAKQKIKALGIYTISVKSSSFNFKNILSIKKQPAISSKELAMISRDLAMYLRAGVPIVAATKLITSHLPKNGRLRIFFQSISSLLDEGKDFYTALEKQKIFKIPDFYKQAIKISENSGILDKVLLELSSYLKEQDKLFAQVQNALFYPGFILSVSIAMVGFMLGFIVPKITSIFEQMHQALPKVTRIVISLGNGVRENWIYILFFILLFISAFILFYKHNKRFRKAIDRVILLIPFFGNIVRNSEIGRFSYISSILLHSGVPFVQTVNMASRTIKNEVIKEIFLESSKSIVEGKKIASTLIPKSDILGASFVQAIGIGEETSELETMLKNLANLYLEENRDKIDIFLSLLEPLLMLMVGSLVGTIVIAMLLPIFSINIGGL